MTTPSDLPQRVVDKMMASDAFSQWLGLEILEVATGRCRLRMTVRPEMTNGFGVLHGGVTFSMADSALAFACNTRGRVTLLIDGNICYPESVHTGDVLVATAEEVKAGGRVSYYQVQVHRDDTLVAMFRSTVYSTSQAHFPDEDDGHS